MTVRMIGGKQNLEKMKYALEATEVAIETIGVRIKELRETILEGKCKPSLLEMNRDTLFLNEGMLRLLRDKRVKILRELGHEETKNISP